MRIKMRLAAVSVAALAAAALSATAGAGTIPVSGTQTVIDEQTGQYEMHGSLVGKWNVTAFKELYKNPSAYAARGTEKFNGCIDVDANGTCEATEPTADDELRVHLLGDVRPEDERAHSRRLRAPGQRWHGRSRRSEGDHPDEGHTRRQRRPDDLHRDAHDPVCAQSRRSRARGRSPQGCGR